MHKAFAFLPALLLIELTPNVSFGYLDPGSGAILWQVIAAVSIGSAVYFRKIIGFCKSVFSKEKLQDMKNVKDA